MHERVLLFLTRRRQYSKIRTINNLRSNLLSRRTTPERHTSIWYDRIGHPVEPRMRYQMWVPFLVFSLFYFSVLPVLLFTILPRHFPLFRYGSVTVPHQFSITCTPSAKSQKICNFSFSRMYWRLLYQNDQLQQTFLTTWPHRSGPNKLLGRISTTHADTVAAEYKYNICVISKCPSCVDKNTFSRDSRWRRKTLIVNNFSFWNGWYFLQL